MTGIRIAALAGPPRATLARLLAPFAAALRSSPAVRHERLPRGLERDLGVGTSARFDPASIRARHFL